MQTSRLSTIECVATTTLKVAAVVLLASSVALAVDPG
jgi:hypothetical protein